MLERRRGKVGVLAEEEVDGRDTEHGRGLLGQQPQRLRRLERLLDDSRAADVEGGVGVHVQPAGVEAGQQVERHVGVGQPNGQANIERVVEDHAKRLQHAFGLAGRAGGVENVPRFVQAARPHDHRTPRRGSQRGLVGHDARRRCWFKRHEAVNAQPLGQCPRRVGESGVIDQRHRRRVAHDELQFRQGQPPVEADEGDLGLGAAPQDLEVVGRVGGQQGHALAGGQPPLAPHELGEAAGAAVELRVGEAPPRGRVDQRRLVRPQVGLLGQPVEGVHSRSRCRAGCLPRPVTLPAIAEEAGRATRPTSRRTGRPP